MQPYEGIYVYVDVDGTLLTDSKALLPEVDAALRRFTEGGGRLGLATGRSPHNIDFYRELVPVNAPCILYNGAAVYDFAEKRYLYRRGIDKAKTCRALEAIYRILPDICAQIFTEARIYEVNPNGRMDPYRAFEPFPVTCCAPEEIPEDWCKLVLSHEHEALVRLERELDPAPYLPEMRFYWAGAPYYELLASTKGDALDALRGILPDAKKILAIGDYMNDLDMVQRADIGGAPANAMQPVLDAADLITCDNNHGAVAEFLARTVFAE